MEETTQMEVSTLDCSYSIQNGVCILPTPGEEQDTREENVEPLDATRLLEDQAYYDWVVSVWNSGAANTEESMN